MNTFDMRQPGVGYRMRSMAVRVLIGGGLLLSAAGAVADVPETFEAAIRLAREQFYQQQDRARARETAARAAALATTVEERVAAAMLEGDYAQQMGEYEPSRAALQRALDIADANPGLRIRALLAMASTWIRERKYAKAHVWYDVLLAMPELPTATRAEVFVNKGDAYREDGQWRAALDTYALGLKGDNLPPRPVFNAWRGIAQARRMAGDAVAMSEAMENAFRQEGGYNINQQVALLRDYALLLTARGEASAAADVWARIVALAGPSREAVFARLDRLADAGKRKDAATFAAAMETADPLAPTQRFQAGLIRAGLQINSQTDAFTRALDELGQRYPVKAETTEAESLSVEQRVEALDAAGKFFMRLRDYAVVRRLLDAAWAFQPPPLCNTLACRFVERAPSDVSAWLRSDLFQRPDNRSDRFIPYNQAAARLLVHDVGQAARDDVVVADEVPKGAETTLSMAADAAGWHVFVQCNDPAVDQVIAGLLGGGKLEMFFRPGERGAYYQWFVSLPHAAEPGPITWDSPHRHYRRMDNYARVQTADTGTGFGVYLFFPWEMLYDRLPQNGDRWPFSLQRWSRLGSTTWGGKVHELNRFGRIVWQDLTPEVEQAIRRSLVLRAWGRYRDARNRLVRHWRDEVMGDPAFYEQALASEVERLDDAGKGIDGDLAGADIDRLFDAFVPEWMEFEYRVAELRTAWLMAGHFE